MEPYQDPNHENNDIRIHASGKTCYECRKEPAGTAWSPYFCFKCNVKRMDRISRNLRSIQESMQNRNKS